jgi:5'-nucleotidase (lipoprotein e(P4) family)
VRQERAAALPGALAFTKYARSRNVEVIYVTNRDSQSKEATRRSLARAGFPLHEGVETLYCLGDQPGWNTDKGSRRAAIARRYRILLLIGDDLGDFLSEVRVSPEQRRRMAASYAGYWGERWIILPNPMYGSWAGSLYGYDSGLSTSEQLRRKRQHLRPMK